MRVCVTMLVCLCVSERESVLFVSVCVCVKERVCVCETSVCECCPNTFADPSLLIKSHPVSVI